MTPAPPGRGSADNPPNRFIPLHYAPDPDCPPDDAPAPATRFFRDSARTIVATNDSPDVGFTHSVNPYRGCEHGCIYCFARPTHEFLGMSAGLDFESKIFVKEDAPELLRRELASPKWGPHALAFSGVTDCYQPAERRFRLTRRCLEVCAEFRNPVGIVTKSRLVTRDLDLLTELAGHKAAVVFLSITTLDADLAGKLEPRAARPAARLAAVEELAKAGVPVGVMAAPMIPGLNDHELPAILEAAAGAGAAFAGYTVVRLSLGLGPLFEAWLDRHYPERKEKVMGRVSAAHGGSVKDARFGMRMRGEGAWADLLHDLFGLTCRKLGLNRRPPEISTAAFRRPGPVQGVLFE
jgi:DNA repair photolyase